MSCLSGGPEIITDGLVLHYDAASSKSYTSGSTTWRDLTINGRNGTLINGPTFSSIYAGSIQFDGVNDYFQANTTLDISSRFTIEYAVSISELPTAGEYNYIYQNGLGYQSNGVYGEFGPFGPGHYMTICQVNSSSVSAGVSVTQPKEANKLYYVTATYENRSLKGYTYGILNQTNSISFDPIVGTTGIFYIGQTGPFTVPFWRFYNRALSATEVLQNYNETKTRFGLT